jgi:4-amino-4-deoxy-L-arabinose transferase-like glycosyltransferase
VDSIKATKPIAAALVMLFVGILFYDARWAIHDYALFKSSDDSGVFLYMGQQIARGAHPYRDVWDTKPPLTYYVNAAGFWLTHSATGVFLLCALAGMVFWLALLRTLWRITPTIWALLAALVCFGGLWDIRVVPNSVEALALPIQAISLWILVSDVLGRAPRYAAVMQGVCAALLLNARFNLVGIAAIWILYCAFDPRFSWQERGRRLAGTAIGGAAGLFAVYLPLLWSGSFSAGINAFLLDGMRFASTSSYSRLECLQAGVLMLSFSPITWLTSVGIVFLTWTALRGKMRQPRLAILAAAWLAVELAMTTVSGYVWPHYFLLVLTPMALLVAVAGAEFDFQTREWLERIRDPHLFRRLGTLVTLSGCATFIGFGCYDLATLELAPREADPALLLARSVSAPGEAVATWGDMSRSFWFDFGHPPGAALFHGTGFPNRTIYLVIGGRMLDDLATHRPPLIVEKSSVVPLFSASDPNATFGSPRAPSAFTGWDDPVMAEKKQVLKQLYSEVGRSGPYVAWRLKTPL